MFYFRLVGSFLNILTSADAFGRFDGLFCNILHAILYICFPYTLNSIRYTSLLGYKPFVKFRNIHHKCISN